MPDINGVLSESDKEKIISWMRTKAVSARCQLCGSTNWSIADHLVAPSVANAAGIGLGQYQYPQAMLISECGQTVFLNLVAVGVIPRG